MGAASTPARICPECGTRNSGLSLFCSECGASLTHAASENQADSQTTTTFTPAAGNETPDPYATEQFRPQPSPGPSTTNSGEPVARDVWSERHDSSPAYDYPVREVGTRGMVLGWIAAILILLVVGFLGWTSFLDQDTRDSIIGIFT